MGKFIESIKNYKNLEFKERTKIMATISMIVNFVFALVKIVLGIITLSVFIIISGCYSIGIGASKQVYFKGIKDAKDQKAEIKYFAVMGVILLITSILYIAYMARLFYLDNPMQYNKIVGIGIAAVSFGEIGLAIYGLVKSNKLQDLLLKGLKIVSFSSALSAIVLTQVALLSFDIENISSMGQYNAMFGVIVGSISAILGIYMLIRSRILSKKVVIDPVDKEKEDVTKN